MELRHLRCFLAVAEELHFSRAADRLHIEPSPLSRVIKELEDDLGLLLFVRNRRRTQLTPAGHVFLQDVRKVLSAVQQARENARTVASGRRGILRIAVSDGATEPRLSTWLARCREEEPEVEVRIVEVTLAEQLRGLHEGEFDAGFARAENIGNGIVAEVVWHDPLLLAIPARHPLLVHGRVPMDEVVRYPVIGCHPDVCEGYCSQVTRLLCELADEPNFVEHATSLDMMLTLVAAGYGIGFVTASQMMVFRHPDVVMRPILKSDEVVLTTYLLRREGNDSAQLRRFILRLNGPLGIPPSDPDNRVRHSSSLNQ
ncbi:TPA: LysR family transcriptional regulator [Pseudomonas aeruginosa]|uniref:LysR family transcriptional regulator n=1 Tax=Pseudomonas TaxID=286 RepID=UPI00106D0833|nr:LysR family transcriptional regulator [Pseudomonas aeruginosa]MBG5754388.1 LysR family transcriptional regulator [Pseudomonas aeruginosa]MBH9109092.1 LysR family transcriptional regulator [Pseudomonas aeruginosa]MBH9458838.1 LysR family transcriptional regulator [Pseudomonas aeruginosa]MBH9463839.1 LysR family transcriptional regulator [Pseudomonas aeruginosa]MCS8374253.1 LysR substrate-binding domain-containing protein [Pseudomonas aeruginosa]